MDLSRRGFLKILGSLGAAGAAGCSAEPPEKIIPYLVPPEEIVPGVATWYATTCRECPAGCGMRVRTREGRAVKVEGTPDHPVNRGGLCARGQASLQGLYNPDRIRRPLQRDPSGALAAVSWAKGEERLAQALREVRRRKERGGIAFVAGRVGPSLDRLVDRWLDAMGSGRRVVYEPFAYEPLLTAGGIAFGRKDIPRFRIADAKFLISFGADFLETWLSPVEFSRDFAEMRKPRPEGTGAYVSVSPRLSLTGANADEWIAVRPGSEVFLVLGMLDVVLREGLAAEGPPSRERERLSALARPYAPVSVAAETGVPPETVLRLGRAFGRARPSLALGGGVAAAGPGATAMEVAVHLLNYAAGNLGRTVRFAGDGTETWAGAFQEMKDLVAAMEGGAVRTLLLYGANPAYSLPPGLGFEKALKKVPFKVSFSSFMDETTALADLVLPDHTPLESWGDYAPRAGVHGLVQPAMRPVFDTKGVGDVLLSVAGRVGEDAGKAVPWRSFYDFLRERWRRALAGDSGGEEFEDLWEKALREGGRWETPPPAPVRLCAAAFEVDFEGARPAGPPEGALALSVYPSMTHFDGRGANRPWLQELPDPMTKVAWDAWIEIHPLTARDRGIREGDVVRAVSPHGAIDLPARLYEGIRKDVAAVPIGQGHRAYGRYAEGRGANPIGLLPAEAEASSGGPLWLGASVKLAKTGRRARLARTDGFPRQLGRGIARSVPPAGSARGGETRTERYLPLRMYEEHPHPGRRWGMSIDLNACVGCGACVVACSAENNVPVAGKDLLVQGREMFWIRIERYFERGPAGPDTRFVPMMCQQCDNAPCEPVCPVYATYHTPEGLNAQVYNRCVGTRYCSNNCPYKVRRFNWFKPRWPEPLNWQLNPDVSARGVGVMEKCTFCVQRIREGKDRAKDEGRPVRDGEIVPACAQSCPTGAIVFGDLNDPGSRVSKLAADDRAYHVLEDLNTKPAVSYLRKVRRDPAAALEVSWRP